MFIYNSRMARPIYSKLSKITEYHPQKIIGGLFFTLPFWGVPLTGITLLLR